MSLSDTDPVRRIQTIQQWALLLHFGEPIRYDDSAGFEQLFQEACGAQNRAALHQAIAALTDRRLLAKTRRDHSIFYTVSADGEAAREALRARGGFFEALTQSQALNELTTPIALDPDESISARAPYDDDEISDSTLEYRCEDAWNESARIMAAWCADVARRVRV